MLSTLRASTRQIPLPRIKASLSCLPTRAVSACAHPFWRVTSVGHSLRNCAVTRKRVLQQAAAKLPAPALGMASTGTATAAAGSGWQLLGAGQQELQLDFCLPTGQSFRWRQTAPGEYTGVVGPRLVVLRQLPHDVSYRVLARVPGTPSCPHEDAAALRDYFNLSLQQPLQQMAQGWAASCARFRAVSPYFPGARMLRQDPLECLFQFICSSNNHISRIHGMVERLCSSYGTLLEPTCTADESPCTATAAGLNKAAAASTAGDQQHELRPLRPAGLEGGPPGLGAAVGEGACEPSSTTAGGTAAGGLSYYAFPTLEQLSAATEEELRAAGFGYRAKFIVGTVAALRVKPGGGRAWLLGLRGVGLEEAVEALVELPGIGPKVAACICLFSLDKHAAIPVDTHVWQIAVRYYRPALAGKSLTKKVHGEVQAIFVERFGPFAGWAHNTLFISELASQQHRLPESLRQGGGNGKGKGSSSSKRRGRQAGADAGEEEDDNGGSSSESEGLAEAADNGGDEDYSPGSRKRRAAAGAKGPGSAGGPEAKGRKGGAKGKGQVEREGMETPVGKDVGGGLQEVGAGATRSRRAPRTRQVLPGRGEWGAGLEGEQGQGVGGQAGAAVGGRGSRRGPAGVKRALTVEYGTEFDDLNT